jgi:DinB superfamily
MNRITSFVDALMFARDYSITLLDTIPTTQWFEMPVGCPSHVAWQVGHLAMAEARLVVERVGGRKIVDEGVLPAEYLTLFMRLTVPSAAPEKYPSPTEIRGVLDRVHETAIRTLRDTNDADLETLVPGSPHRFCRTKADYARWASHHEFLHAGQIGMIRRMLGSNPVW